MLKILINCPGGWSHGLDSPERGEGRWAQNLTRCLAKSKQYGISACSGGNLHGGAAILSKTLRFSQNKKQNVADLMTCTSMPHGIIINARRPKHVQTSMFTSAT